MKLNHRNKLEKCVSTDETHPRIQNAFLDLGDKAAPVLVATTGSVLAVIPVEVTEHDTPGYVSVDAIKLSHKKPNMDEIVVNDDQKLASATLPRPKVEELGEFPNWRMLVEGSKKKETKFEIRLNAELLKNLQEALGSYSVTLRFTGAKNAIEVTGARGMGMGLLMPMLFPKEC